MADAGYFRVISHLHQTRVNKLTQTLQGTSADQDNRFSDKEKKLMNSMRFEESLAKKVDMKKVTPLYCQEIFMLPSQKRFHHTSP